jgi:plastocyanin
MAAFFLLPTAGAQRSLFAAAPAPAFQQASTFMPRAQVPQAYAPMYDQVYEPQFEYAYAPAADPYVVYETNDSSWSDFALPVAFGALLGVAASAATSKPKVSMLAVSGTVDKVKQAALAGLVSLGLFAGAANAVDVKLGSDSGQLVFVPDEVSIKVGDSVTWIGNKGMPHNVVFDEDEAPDGADLAAINHEDMVGNEGQKVTSTFKTKGKYAYYCEPHRGAGMNGTVNVE